MKTGGPLSGLKVVEFAGIGPAPFVAMVLADLGAEVLRIDRLGTAGRDPADITGRGRAASLEVDLKDAATVARLRGLVAGADAIVEGFRPGVMERLGLGPDVLLGDNPRLVYTRITGWGQSGPLADRAGHDINYIALSGSLHAIGGADAPVAPLNLVGDFGGGAMLALVGMLAALFERSISGRGQVVDAAMTDGSALLMAFIYGMKAQGKWADSRGANILDGAAPFYTTYACRDGRHIAVGPIERQFYGKFIEVLGCDDGRLASQSDPAAWPEQKRILAEMFRTRDRDDWVVAFDGVDACVAPVLTMEEAPNHPHNQHRGTFVTYDGVVQPAPAPRFDRTPGALGRNPAADVAELLTNWDVDPGLFTRS